jgi:hypothetical protein
MTRRLLRECRSWRAGLLGAAGLAVSFALLDASGFSGSTVGHWLWEHHLRWGGDDAPLDATYFDASIHDGTLRISVYREDPPLPPPETGDALAFGSWDWCPRRWGWFGLTHESRGHTVRVQEVVTEQLRPWTPEEIAAVRAAFAARVSQPTSSPTALQDDTALWRAELARDLIRGAGSTTRPLPWGYAHNALALTSLTLLITSLTALPRWLHTRRASARLAHGRCPRCQYPLAGLPTPTCPECGQPLPPSAPASNPRPPA